MSRKDRECRGCGQGLIEGYRFCPNCRTPQPSPLRPEANPAPTFTPEAILASLEEGKQEQAAEANHAGSPEPVHETARVPPLKPDDGVPQPATEPITPPPQERATQDRQMVSDRMVDTWAAAGTGIVLGLLVFVLLVWLGLNGGVSLLIAFLVALGAFNNIRRTPLDARKKTLVSTAPVRSRNIPQWVKIAVATRDSGKCRSCGSAYELQYDHVIPFSRGGSSDVNNIQLLCGRCNRRKSNRYIG